MKVHSKNTIKEIYYLIIPSCSHVDIEKLSFKLEEKRNLKNMAKEQSCQIMLS